MPSAISMSKDAYPEVSFRPNDPILKSQMRFWMKHVDVKLHPSCGAIQWPMIMRDSMLKRSEDERNVLLSKIPEKPRRERQKRLIQYGLDAPDVSDAVKTYYKTIVDMEKALSQHKWLVGNEFSLADIGTVYGLYQHLLFVHNASKIPCFLIDYH